jgi:hypothetical protein
MTLLKIVFSLGIVVLATIHMRWPTTFDQYVLLLALLAVLPWITPFLREHFSRVALFGASFELVAKELSKQSRRIDELYLLSIGDNAFQHLRKLNRPEGYGSFYVSTALPRELEFLENLGYIRFKGGLKGLDDFMDKIRSRPRPEGENLSDEVELTVAGKSFVDLREEAAHSKKTLTGA